MTQTSLWDQLLDALGEWLVAADPEAGQIDVRVPRPATAQHDVRIVMTPDQWDDMTVVFGRFDDMFEHLRERLLGIPPDCGYAVYETYDLVACRTPELPPDPGIERLNALAREHPEGIGGWFAYGPED